MHERGTKRTEASVPLSKQTPERLHSTWGFEPRPRDEAERSRGRCTAQQSQRPQQPRHRAAAPRTAGTEPAGPMARPLPLTPQGGLPPRPPTTERRQPPPLIAWQRPLPSAPPAGPAARPEAPRRPQHPPAPPPSAAAMAPRRAQAAAAPDSASGAAPGSGGERRERGRARIQRPAAAPRRAATTGEQQTTTTWRPPPPSLSPPPPRCMMGWRRTGPSLSWREGHRRRWLVNENCERHPLRTRSTFSLRFRWQGERGESAHVREVGRPGLCAAEGRECACVVSGVGVADVGSCVAALSGLRRAAESLPTLPHLPQCPSSSASCSTQNPNPTLMAESGVPALPELRHSGPCPVPWAARSMPTALWGTAFPSPPAALP